jgi:predicted nucleic acid-binding protein
MLSIEIVVQRSQATRLRCIVEDADVAPAPDLFVAEVVNTMWKSPRSFLLAPTTRRPAYEMFYVALARREDATLPTTGLQLRKEAERQGIRVA